MCSRLLHYVRVAAATPLPPHAPSLQPHVLQAYWDRFALGAPATRALLATLSPEAAEALHSRVISSLEARRDGGCSPTCLGCSPTCPGCSPCAQVAAPCDQAAALCAQARFGAGVEVALDASAYFATARTLALVRITLYSPESYSTKIVATPTYQYTLVTSTLVLP